MVSSEWESGIGCKGATAPADRLGWITLRSVDSAYAGSDFSKDITNVDASHLFTQGAWTEGAHSDFWYSETLHLIASIADQSRV